MLILLLALQQDIKTEKIGTAQLIEPLKMLHKEKAPIYEACCMNHLHGLDSQHTCRLDSLVRCNINLQKHKDLTKTTLIIMFKMLQLDEYSFHTGINKGDTCKSTLLPFFLICNLLYQIRYKNFQCGMNCVFL